MPEEKQLVRRAKENDKSAWEEIYERHKQQIYRYICYHVGDDLLAEDLMQDVFARALDSIGSFTFRGVGLVAWLLRIARNLVIDQYRRQPEHPPLALEEELMEGIGGSPEEILERKLTSQELRDSLSHLTEKQREVIILKFVDGLSNAEVAQVMGKTEGAIKSLQHRALTSLAGILQKGS